MKSISAALALVGLVASTGCDVPTEAPILEQRWILPVESTTLSVDELLPSGVSVSGNAFAVNLATFSAESTLLSLCAKCASLVGQTGPAPDFQGVVTSSQTLPADVLSAVLTSGSIQVAAQSQFNFDPLAGGGTIRIALQDGPGGRSLGEATISGPFAPGSTATRVITLPPGAIGKTLVATTTIASPGGQSTTITGLQKLVVTATPGSIRVGSATVNVANRAVSFDAVALDVEDIDSEIADRIENGALRLKITNPFGVALTAQVNINYPGGRLSKTLNISNAAQSTASLSYSGDEFRTFLGRPGVTFSGTGTVSAGAGSITVTPGQKAVLDAEIDLTIRIGG